VCILRIFSSAESSCEKEWIYYWRSSKCLVFFLYKTAIQIPTHIGIDSSLQRRRALEINWRPICKKFLFKFTGPYRCLPWHCLGSATTTETRGSHYREKWEREQRRWNFQVAFRAFRRIQARTKRIHQAKWRPREPNPSHPRILLLLQPRRR